MTPVARRKTLRLLSNGMYVMTSRSGARYGGATVTWVSQVSFKPPLIMAAIRKECSLFHCLSKSGVAALHILGTDQAGIARKFFQPTRADGDVLNDEPFGDGATSSPVLHNAPAYVECRVRRIHDDLGDHAVVILEVLQAECRREVEPLTIAASPWEYGG
jgi:flavin reductase (DIM6/NTAB) family NADH-FMN oxidoreductase RutF